MPSPVLASVELGYKDLTFFNANPTLVLLEGQIVYLSQTGQFKIGDGTTQLSSLSFLGGATSYTFQNGVDEISPGIVGLGGALTQNTDIDGAYNLRFGQNTALNNFIVGSAYTEIYANSGLNGTDVAIEPTSIYLSASGDGFNTDSTIYVYPVGESISDNGSNNHLIISDTAANKGLVGAADYQANYTPNTYVQKKYVTDTFLPLAGGTLTGNLNSITPTQLGYLTTLTSNVQTQIDAKVGVLRLTIGTSAVTVSPADSSTYYCGDGSAPITSLPRSRLIPVPYTLNITRASISIWCNSAVGSNENSTFEIEQYSAAGSLLSTHSLSSTVTWSDASKSNLFNVTGLSFTITGGNFILLKITTPAWATNPGVCWGTVTLGYL